MQKRKRKTTKVALRRKRIQRKRKQLKRTTLYRQKKKRKQTKQKTQKVTLYPRSVIRTEGPMCGDLFSGGGGLAEGFRQAGWNVVFASDLDAGASATFRKNFPEASFLEGPISKITGETIMKATGLVAGQLDCLIGGPPCQSFSYNNHQRSADDERARLFRRYLKIVATLLPKTLVMENVPGMLSVGDGAIVAAIKRKLKKLGYEIEIRILYAEDFGVPQQRRRVFVIASRVGDPTDMFPDGTHGPAFKPSIEANPYVHRWEAPEGATLPSFRTVGEAIGDLPRLASGGGDHERAYGNPAKTDYQRALRGGAEKLHNHVCHALTSDMLRRIRHVREGGNWRDIPRRLLTAGMKRARKSDHTKRYGRLKRTALASTILTKCDPHWGAYVHPTQNRTITVREAARLQGFRDTFVFEGVHLSKQYEQVGNAVPPPLAAAIGAKGRVHVEAAPIALAVGRPRAVTRSTPTVVERQAIVTRALVAARRVRRGTSERKRSNG
jgi:DNA (cytosine-5)-methyltransferase 1